MSDWPVAPLLGQAGGIQAPAAANQGTPAGYARPSAAAQLAAPDWLRDEYTIETPESVTFGYEVAGIGSRLIGALIDTILVAALLGLLNLLLYALLFWMEAEELLFFGLEGEIGWGPGLLIALYALLQMTIIWGYFIGFELLLNGQTPGKRLAHTRVVRLDGSPAGALEVAVRNLVRLVDFLPAFYALGFVTMVSNERARRLGDFAAGTLVVREERAITLASLRSESAAAPAQTVPAPLPAAPAPAGSLRRLTRDDVALVQETLRREAVGSVPPALLQRLAVLMAQRIGAPPPAPGAEAARSWLTALLAEDDRRTRSPSPPR